MDLRSKLVLNGARVAFVVAVAAMAAAPFLFSATHIVLLTEFMSMLVLAIMWNLLAGYADIVTVGQHAFVGIGAYAFFGFTALWGLNPYLAIPLGGLVALVISVPTMILVFRLRTAYLAIGTWVVAELLMLAAGKLSAWGGGWARACRSRSYSHSVAHAATGWRRFIGLHSASRRWPCW